jgi:hypothetical protein
MTEQNEKSPAYVMPMIYSSMSKVLAEVDSVGKGKTSVGKFSFKYRSIDDVMNALHSAFATHSVFMTQELLEHKMAVVEGRGLHHIAKYRFRFYAIDGSFVECISGGECIESGDKGLGKTASYALKTCLLQTFLIPTEDDSKDPDSTNQPLIQNFKRQEPNSSHVTDKREGIRDAILKVLNTPGIDWFTKTGKSFDYLVDKTKAETDIVKLNSFWASIQKLIQTEP